MAIATILRRTASAAAPLVTRAVSRSQKFHHGSALLSAAVNRAGAGGLSRQALSRSLLPSAGRFYSSRPSSDESLLRIIDSEIKCAEECDDQKVVDDVPDGFPFKIEDTPGQQTISFTRKYQDETITVEVHMPDLVTGEDEDDDDDADDDEKSNQSNIPLVVKVSKKRGPCLEFTITAFPDEISIDNLSVKDPDSSEDEIAYEGPDFADLDENLQKAFHKYLEIRGIKPSTTNFLHEYMINKDSKEYLMWLKNVKAFIKA